MTYQVRIESFEGPLDLLLHLIKKHEMDIYDIPIAEITSQYLATLETMKNLNLEVAGDFLVMAATLLHIKSKMLLPQPVDEDPEEEEVDPRAELVRRLLEYQKYQDGGRMLDDLPRLGRDVFTSAVIPEVDDDEGEQGFLEVGLFDLVEALNDLLREAPPTVFHNVAMDQLSVTERINEILVFLADRPRTGFSDLLARPAERSQVIVTFLALLELVRLRVVRLVQDPRNGVLWLLRAVEAEHLHQLRSEEDSLGYS